MLAISPVPVTVVALLLPWSASGTSARSAFSLAHALQGIGTVLPAWERFGLHTMDALPAIVACSLAAAVLGRIRLSAALGVLAAVFVVAASTVALVDFGSGARVGAWVGDVGCSIATAVALTITVRKVPGHV